jgi:hypothetical protein
MKFKLRHALGCSIVELSAEMGCGSGSGFNEWLEPDPAKKKKKIIWKNVLKG